ncbi:pyocin knob domain-containing protein [Serratia ureilytica]|uniref:pyocin knob domain-containing protein n=1 Tax=Serratia ureilytica TaxID=300181 RepID=UPI001F5C6753|nr:pyocin knob domain-containing protein [Serratia ureilytica]
MIIGFGNNVVSSLAADITATQTTIQVMPGAGALFAGLLTYDYANDSNPLKVYAKITLTDAKETVFEVCHLTAVNNDMLTVVRGQEGTAAKGWSLNDVIANFATRGSENQFVQIEQLQSGHYTSAVAGGTANGLTLALPATFFLNGSTEWALKTPILIYPTLNNTGASTLQLTMGGRVMGTYPLVKGSNTALRAGDIVAKNPFLAVFNADQGRFIVLNPTTDVGSVRSVNAIGPDVGGNVTLKALDVGALPVYPNALTVDLNTLGATSQAGVYCQTKNAGATDEYHYPIKLAGSLLLKPSAYGCQQEYTEYTAGRKFVRDLTGLWNGKDGPWGDWREYFSENHLPPSYGWGMGPQHRDNAYNNVAMVYRINGASANAPGPNVYGVVSLPCDGGPSTSYLAVQNSGRAFFGYSNKPENGVIWTEAYTVKNPPTADVIGAVKKSGDTMTGQLIAPSVATTPGAIPWGAGPFSEQLNNQAPFFQPNWQWPVTAGGIFAPIAKGVVTRKGQGYPTAVSFGYLLNGTPSFAIPCIHAKGDNVDVNWRFDPNSGQFYSPGAVLASGAIFHTDGNITGNIWGGYLSNWLNQNISNAQNNAQNWAYQNLVQNVRLTGRINQPDTGGQVRVPDGCVFTGMSGANYDPSIWASYSYVQILINGSWRNIGTS